MNATETPPRKKFAFGNYEILDTHGSGGMGVVYRAIDMQFGRPVALKILRDDLRTQEHIVARFQREAEAIATLNHPNIVHVYSVGNVGKIPYLAMEFIEGTTLGMILAERGPMPWREALEIGAQIADALASAHDSGIIHRDIKPGNILIDPQGKVFVTDFGIAKVMNATTKLTVDGSRLGTPQYMSPERCKNKEIVPASDIYSLGVLLYQAICGRLPYEANSPVELVAKITGEDPVRITEYMPNIPPNVDRLLAHMLDPNPKARPQSARQLLGLIERVMAGLPLVENEDAAEKALRNLRRQLDREATPRIPEPKPAAKAQKVSARERIAGAWFRVPRGARVAMAVGVLAAACAGIGVLGWRVAQVARPGAAFRVARASAEAWRVPVSTFSVTQESKGVALVRLNLPDMQAGRVVAAAGAADALSEVISPEQPGTMGVMKIAADPIGAEMVFTPAPVAGGSAELLAAGVTADGVLNYAFLQGGHVALDGNASPLPPNASLTQPLPGKDAWVFARLLAGEWRVETTGMNPLTLPLPTGPVRALSVAPDGNGVALVTGTETAQVLWTLSLAPGAAAVERGRGRFALSAQAFSADAQHFAVVAQSHPDAPREVQVFEAARGEGRGLTVGNVAAYAGERITFLANDRAGHAQLWSIDPASGETLQLSFLGAGLGESFAVLPGNHAAAPVAGQASVALIDLP